MSVNLFESRCTVLLESPVKQPHWASYVAVTVGEVNVRDTGFLSVDVHIEGLVCFVEKHGRLFCDISKKPTTFVFVIKGSSIIKGEPWTFFFSRNVGSQRSY